MIIDHYIFGSGGVTYDDWFLASFRDTVRMRNNITSLNSALSGAGHTTLSLIYYTCTERGSSHPSQIVTRLMSVNSTVYIEKNTSRKIRYFRRETMSDTSGYSVADFAFGGIVVHVETNVQLHIMCLEEFSGTEWANDTSTYLGYNDWDDGPGNTAGVAAATTTSRAQDALDYVG